jgi:inner membrane protein
LDTLTHALSGALLGRLMARPPVSGASVTAPPAWKFMAAGALAAAFPDADFVLGMASDLAYLRGHRGITHSVLLLPLWGFLLAWLLPALLRMRRAPGDWRTFYAVSCAAIGIHIVGDLITQFGTMIFAPVSDRRFGFGTTFIIDLVLSALLLAGVAASALWRRSRLPAAAALLLVGVWIGVGAFGRQQAITFARDYATRQGIDAVLVSAIPRPASPFNWTAVVDDGSRYHIAHINTLRRELLEAGPDASFFRRYSAPYLPLASARWQLRERFGAPDQRDLARAAWNADVFGVIRWFDMFPVLDSAESGPDGECALFRDLRFETPGRAGVPFRYGACREAAQWRLFEQTVSGRRWLATD